MQIGVFLPISGRAAGPDVLREAAQSAEARVRCRLVGGPRGHALAIETSYP